MKIIIVSFIIIILPFSSQSFAEDRKKPSIPNIENIISHTGLSLSNKARVKQRKSKISKGNAVVNSKGKVIGAISKNQKCIFYGNYVNGKARENAGINVRKMVFRCR